MRTVDFSIRGDLLIFRDKKGVHSYELQSGQNDDISVYREQDVTYVLSINRRFGYVGLDALHTEKPEDEPENRCVCFQDIFLQNECEIEESLGRSGLDLTDITIAKKLADLLQEMS